MFEYLHGNGAIVADVTGRFVSIRTAPAVEMLLFNAQGEDSVDECVDFNGSATVKHSYNKERGNNEPVDNVS